jgi:hypothetical protein
MIKALQEQTCEIKAGVVDAPKLVVSRVGDSVQVINGTNPPQMPQPTIKVQLKNYKGDDVDFHYTLKIHWKSPDEIKHKKGNPTPLTPWETPKNPDETYTGDTTGGSDKTINWKLNLDKYGMRGGNDMTLIVTATTKAEGKVYNTNPDTLKNLFVIKGKNPTVAIVLAEFSKHLYTEYTTDNYAAVAWDESRFNQFSMADSDNFIAHPHSTTPTYPLKGPPSGFGLMQIDPPPADSIVWNWVANVQEGQDQFNKNIDAAKNYQNRDYFKENYDTPPDSLKNVPTSPDTIQNQVFLQAYAYYNSGSARYWKWVEPVIDDNDGTVTTAGHWIRDPACSSYVKKHVNQTWEFFLNKQKLWLK